MFVAHKCELCGMTYRCKPNRCEYCNYPTFREVELSAEEYCKIFGHDGGEIIVPGTTEFLEKRWGEYGGEIPWAYEYSVYTHEHLFKCARCGHEKKRRCKGCGS